MSVCPHLALFICILRLSTANKHVSEMALLNVFYYNFNDKKKCLIMSNQREQDKN